MTTQNDVYKNLQKHLHKMPIGYPPTKQGIEINILKSIFTPEQAELAIYLGYKYKSVDEIFESVKEKVSSKEELIQTLDEIVSKGGIKRKVKDNQKHYAILPLVLWGMYEHQVKRLDQNFLNDVGQYLMGEFGLEMATGRLPKMRVIPIEESVKTEHNITTYDELKYLIEQAGDQIAVQDCVCRKVFDMQGNPCEVTDRREVCMSMGELADLYVEEGWARKLSKEEALELARKNEEEGLVLMPSNAIEPTFMCSCCSDCCGMLSMIKNFPKPAEAVGSNYLVEVDAKHCKKCETCIKRCPTDAVKLNETRSVIDLKRCIGCGLCVPTCPENAIHLIKKEKEIIPLKTDDDRLDYELEKKSTLAGKTRNYLLKSFIRTMMRFSS